MDPLTDKEKKYYDKSKRCYICGRRFCYDKKQKEKFKLYRKVRDYENFTGKFKWPAHGICNLRYSIPHEIPLKFHNGSSYDYHLIIKKFSRRI